MKLGKFKIIDKRGKKLGEPSENKKSKVANLTVYFPTLCCKNNFLVV